MFKKLCLAVLFVTGFQLSAVWAEDDGDLLRYNRFTVEDGLSQNSILAITKDKYGFMWFGTWEGANRFDGYHFTVYRADLDNPEALSNNRVSIVLTDSAGNVWLNAGDDHSIFRFYYESETFRKIRKELAPMDVRRRMANFGVRRKIAENAHQKWKATDKGLFLTDKRKGTVQNIRLIGKTYGSSTIPLVSCVFLDDVGNVWMGTPNEGILVAGQRIKPFGLVSALSGKNIKAISVDKAGRMWIGTESDGVYVMDSDPGANIVRHLGKEELVNTSIRALQEDRAGRMWIGTKGGLDRCDTKTWAIKHYKTNKTGTSRHNWVFCINEDRDGNLWAGTFGGLARYDAASDRFTYLPSAGILKSPNVRALLEDDRHRFWIGTEGGGLTCLQEGSGGRLHSPKHFQHELGNENSLVNDLVLTLAEDEDKNIWIGTNSGLCRLDPETGTFDRFSVSNGFPDDLILGLSSDRKGHVWISHKKGLTCMDIRTLAMRNFNQSDGLQSNEFNQNAFFRHPTTGKMHFGGTNGVNAFFPEQIRVNPIRPRPVLTGLRVMNQPVLPGKEINDRVVLKQALMFTKSIRLKWDERSFTIAYSSLNYDNPKGCRFRYRLREMDLGWNDVDANIREVTYAHLQAGSYRFEVYASNSDGLWSEQPAFLDIRILPPWWFSPWAWMVYVLMLVSLAWFVYRYLAAKLEYRRNLMRERLQNEKNEELSEAKLQFFTEISHEFRTPLTLIIDPLEQLSAGTVPSEKMPQFYQLMNRNAKQLLDLINQLLDFRKVQSKALELNAAHSDLVEFVRQVVSVFDQRAQSQQVRLIVQAQESSLWMDFDDDKVRKIINNLVSNALKYSPIYGQITIRLYRLEPDRVRLEVQDMGPGIDPAFHDKIFEAFFQAGDARKNAYGTGIGLALTRELVLLHGGSIRVKSEKGQGSCFVIDLPVSQANVQESNTFVTPGKVLPIAQPSSSSLSSEEKPLLLFVDDHADIRDYIRLNFGDAYEVVTAMDGLEGFNKAAEIVPDIVVSDVMMDGMDGFELCKRLKSDERTSHIPVILLTARQTDESRVEGYGMGADAYITKPFNTEVLTARMGNLLEQRQLLQKHFSQGSALEIRKIPVNVTDEAFLNKTVGLIEQHMEDPDFDPDRLAELLRMSRSQLYRKIKGMTNRSVQEFMTSIRMNKALEFLLSGTYSISETAYKVGFSLPTNFTRTFTKQFGLSPSKYLEKHRK